MEIKREGLFTYHPLSDKEKKNLAILGIIRKKGPISRTEISKITDINMVSVSNYTKDYLAKNIILEKGLDESSGGRRPELVELNRGDIYVIGIDISSTDTRAAITNLTMDVKGKIKIPNPKFTKDELADKIKNLIQELAKASKIDLKDVKAIGIGASDQNNYFVSAAVERKAEIPTFGGSDAACAAFGEKTLNPKADVADLLYMHSDVGCGIIVRGDIYFGAAGFAGEMRDTEYLRPWGAYLGIIDSAKREIEKGVGTKMVAIAKGSVDNLTKEVVIEAAKQNDEVASYIIQNAAMNLGLRAAYLVNLFNPEVVVIGGGIEKAGPLILEPVIDKIKKFAFARQANTVRIIPSALGEDAVSLGAASLAVREIFLGA